MSNPEPQPPPQEGIRDYQSVRPKRKEIGRIGSEVVYQLGESIGCLDCFRSIPEGSIVAMQKVSSEANIPVCMYFAGLNPANLKLTGKVQSCDTCNCPAFQDGSVKDRVEYAKNVRSFS